MSRLLSTLMLPGILIALFALSVQAKDTNLNNTFIDSELLKGRVYRSIGPYRGGRSAAITGVADDDNTFYFGATGGGVWRTVDAGMNWENISDGYFGGSIGSVAVSEWDTNIIYVGGGEVTVRGNVSHGDGVWKSLDKGKTWQHMGLSDSRRIPRIRIHPKNPDLVYAAVLGHLYGPNEERGVYRSRDGGRNWERILYVSDVAGAVDLVMDPNNPRILYASTWKVKRTPYSLESGGEGSALWKSTDGGDSWVNLMDNDGMPEGTIGIIGVTVSPQNSERIWAMIEAKEGGLFRSENGGETWARVNDERKLRQRAWYYTRVYADPADVDSVYVVNVQLWKSKDGGKSFTTFENPPPHGDHHDLWLNPNNPTRIASANDGGGQISVDAGNSWSTYMNQPTAQFYRVTTDDSFPYRIYGGQQDNSTVRIYHRSSSPVIGLSDWEPTAGGESAHIAPRLDNPDIVYGGSYDGLLVRLNHDNNQSRQVDVWPDNPMGKGAGELKYRFQWNFPIFISPHDNNILYTAANHLFKSIDEGQSWQEISGDLTRNDISKMGSSGGPITQDNTSVEYYGTIFAALESPHEAGVLWTGSDDGLVHVSRDAGATWTNVTPPKMPEWMQINSIEADPFNPGGLYLVGTRYKLDDFKPYIYKTENYGKTWKLRVKGIDENHFTRVVRADPHRQGLLFAGTENGVYISFDDGKKWHAFQLNLPQVPITDLAIKEKDLVVATQGRSFWILDDLSWLQQFDERHTGNVHLYEPRDSYRFEGYVSKNPRNAGANPPNGVYLDFFLNEVPEKKKSNAKEEAENDDAVVQSEEKPIVLIIMDQQGKEIRRFSTAAKEDKDKLNVQKGLNRFVWDMRYPDASDFEGMIVWAGGTTGPKVVPGKYSARLEVGDVKQTVSFTILKDPRVATTQADFQQQFDFLLAVNDKISEVTGAISNMRKMRDQIAQVTDGMKNDKVRYKEVLKAAKSLKDKLSDIEKNLYQVKNRSPQDPLNFPGKLLNSLMGSKSVVSMGDYPPTQQAINVRNQVVRKIDVQLARLKGILSVDVKAFNALIADQNLPALRLDNKNVITR